MHKLKMAGASKVIIIDETGANITDNMLINTMVFSFLEQILSIEQDLNIVEVVIKKDSDVIGKKLKELTSWPGISYFGLIDKEISNNFIFAHSEYNHKIDEGDALILLGKDETIEVLLDKPI